MISPNMTMVEIVKAMLAHSRLCPGRRALT
jgi:hypothetical protein